MFPFLCRPVSSYHAQWKKILQQLQKTIDQLKNRRTPWDMIYLGRNRFGDDQPTTTSSSSSSSATTTTCTSTTLVRPGFSTCAHAYVLSTTGLQAMSRCIETVNQTCGLPPVDDLIPAMYSQHPRVDLNRVVKAIGSTLRVFAYPVDKVWQLESLLDNETDYQRSYREVPSHPGGDPSHPGGESTHRTLELIMDVSEPRRVASVDMTALAASDVSHTTIMSPRGCDTRNTKPSIGTRHPFTTTTNTSIITTTTSNTTPTTTKRRCVVGGWFQRWMGGCVGGVSRVMAMCGDGRAWSLAMGSRVQWRTTPTP